MSAAEFQELALGWIAVALTVGTAGTLAYFKLKSLIDDLRSKHEANATAIDANAKRIDAHDNLQGVKTTVDSVGTTTISPQSL